MTNKEAIKYLQQIYPNGGCCWLDEQRIEAIGIAINALQEEPVSEDLEEAALMHFKDIMEYEVKHGLKMANITSFKAGAKWQKEQMMKKAFSAEIGKQRPDYKCVLNGNFFKYDTGDKVKLIIVKED